LPRGQVVERATVAADDAVAVAVVVVVTNSVLAFAVTGSDAMVITLLVADSNCWRAVRLVDSRRDEEEGGGVDDDLISIHSILPHASSRSDDVVLAENNGVVVVAVGV